MLDNFYAWLILFPREIKFLFYYIIYACGMPALSLFAAVDAYILSL